MKNKYLTLASVVVCLSIFPIILFGCTKTDDKLTNNETEDSIKDDNDEAFERALNGHGGNYLVMDKSAEQNSSETAEPNAEQTTNDSANSTDSISQNSSSEQQVKEDPSTNESSSSIENDSSKSVKSNEVKINNTSEITSNQKDMLMATAQVALKRNEFKDDTSSNKKDWIFSKNERDGKTLFNVVTKSKKLNRVKVIFEWTGDDKDDLSLVYFLVNGQEITNNLK